MKKKSLGKKKVTKTAKPKSGKTKAKRLNTSFDYEFEDDFHGVPVQDCIVFKGEATPEMEEFFEKLFNQESEALIDVVGAEVDEDEIQDGGYNEEGEHSSEDFPVHFVKIFSISSTEEQPDDPRTIQEFYEEVKACLEKDLLQLTQD
jgi:hypothetical protein